MYSSLHLGQRANSGSQASIVADAGSSPERPTQPKVRDGFVVWAKVFLALAWLAQARTSASGALVPSCPATSAVSDQSPGSARTMRAPRVCRLRSGWYPEAVGARTSSVSLFQK